MDQILWVGCLESDEEFKIKASKGYDLASAQVSQKNLIEGIESVSGITMDTINGSVLPPYPAYRDKVIETVKWHHAKESFDISVGYKNYRYINRVNCKNAMLKAAEQWCKKRYYGGSLSVFVYSMRSAPMATACRIKELIPNAKIYLIVSDLPQFMDLGQSKVKALLKSFDWKSIKKMQNQFDGFILYASKMAEFLEIPDGQWLLMEGSYDAGEITLKDGIESNPADKLQKAIMYSGKLDENYGIKMLIQAFLQLEDDSLELWLTGGGNAESYIKECAERDHRIKFYGFLPCREDVLYKQRQASLLINMRLPSEPASAYCFPSKLFEYMATGVPVLSFCLEGISEEYYPYLYLIKEESVSGLKEAIMEAMNIEDTKRKQTGKNAQAFVLEKKNTIAQSKRIIDFIQTGYSI